MDVTIKISGNIYTDIVGIRKLYSFYKRASVYRDQHINIDFSRLEFLDGNLCALLLSLIYKLRTQNNLTFSTNGDVVRSRFHFLIRNGFVKSAEEVADVQKSTLDLKFFRVDDLDKFVEYVQQDLKSHKGLNLKEEVSNRIMDSIIEVATNIEIHANTQEPFFACGQYFEQSGVFKFSMVDLGHGFLPAIAQQTAGKISTNIKAIKWAMERGNTTKKNEPGGLGLPDLHDYFKSSNGNMQIITGNALWSTEFAGQKTSHRKFNAPCFGTMINLLFSYN